MNAVDVSDAAEGERRELESLPDALLLLIFSYLQQPALGRSLAVSMRWGQLASDDQLWRAVCDAKYGLKEPKRGDGTGCVIFLEAARSWSRVASSVLGRPADEPMPALAPLWLRTNSMWASIVGWAEKHLPDAAASIAPGASQGEWTATLGRLDLDLSPTHEPLLALRLLYAVHDGQRNAFDAKSAARELTRGSFGPRDLCQELEAAAATWFGNGSTSGAAGPDPESLPFIGLGGGFSAYDQHPCVRLLPLSLLTAWTLFMRNQVELPPTTVVAACSYDLRRVLCYDLESGDLMFGHVQGRPALQGRPAVQVGALRMLRAVPTEAARGHDLLLWLEELARRLGDGVYQASPLIPLEPLTKGVCLFPQDGPKLSTCVTRGIRVTSSSVFAPEMGTHVYSIRLKLLSPFEEGYQSAEQRGFVTAQLHTRHWVLRQSDGSAELVDGDGVVGRFPLLREGGWREDRQTDASGRIGAGEEEEGLFIYQSMSGRGGTISFEGHIMFVPGSLRQPRGEEFAVAVARFPLVCEPADYVF